MLTKLTDSIILLLLLDYTSRKKDYFLIEEHKTFDEAITLCRSRGENLVLIKNEAEDEFVINTIVKPAGYCTWLGATNPLGTKEFKWLTDGSDVSSNCTNRRVDGTYQDVNQQNAM